MQEQWEYKTLWPTGTLNRSLRDADGNSYGYLNAKTADGVLNALGKQGWEVCGLSSTAWDTPVVVLKRRIAPK